MIFFYRGVGGGGVQQQLSFYVRICFILRAVKEQDNIRNTCLKHLVIFILGSRLREYLIHRKEKKD